MSYHVTTQERAFLIPHFLQLHFFVLQVKCHVLSPEQVLLGYLLYVVGVTLNKTGECLFSWNLPTMGGVTRKKTTRGK